MDRLPLWLAWKSLYRDRNSFDLSNGISLIGLILGVACLVIAMAVVSGFSVALQKSIVDVTGDVLVLSRSRQMLPWPELLQKVKKADSDVLEGSPFLFVEGLLAHKGKISGVAVQGIEENSVGRVLNLENRLVEGEFDLSQDHSGGDLIPALLGKQLVKSMGLKVGESFRVVFPIASQLGSGELKRRLGRFRLVGVLSLGKYDYDSRYIMAPLKSVQKLVRVKVGRDYTGLYTKLTSSSMAERVSKNLNKKLDHPYWTRRWQAVEHNLFEAIVLEKAVIFIVVFIMILAAALNMASSLYIRVIKKYSEVAIMKSMGLSADRVLSVFRWQGIIIGVFGSLCGIVLGVLFCFIFEVFVSRTGFLPQDVYRLSEFSPIMKTLDLVLIFSATTLVCFIATLAPAYRGSRLKPVEGLRYE